MKIDKGKVIGMGLIIGMMGAAQNKAAKNQAKEKLQKMEELSPQEFKKWEAKKIKQEQDLQMVIYACSAFIGMTMMILFLIGTSN